MSVGYQVKQNLKSHGNSYRKVSRESGPKIDPATGVRGLIVVSIVSRRGEVCIAYTWVFSQFMGTEAYSWILVSVLLG